MREFRLKPEEKPQKKASMQKECITHRYFCFTFEILTKNKRTN